MKKLLSLSALFLALAFTSAAKAQTATPVVVAEPTRTFGGCNKIGTFCAGPSALVTVGGYDLTHHKVVGSFAPGLGYGFTIHPNDWYATGLDGGVSLNTSGQSSLTLMFKFANYIHVGISRQFGDSGAAWIVPIGFGIDIP